MGNLYTLFIERDMFECDCVCVCVCVAYSKHCATLRMCLSLRIVIFIYGSIFFVFFSHSTLCLIRFSSVTSSPFRSKLVPCMCVLSSNAFHCSTVESPTTTKTTTTMATTIVRICYTHIYVANIGKNKHLRVEKVFLETYVCLYKHRELIKVL